MKESHAARLAAANFILGLEGIARHRIAIDEYGRLFIDREPLSTPRRNRVGVLTVIILDCIGGDTDPDISNRLAGNPNHRADTMWVPKHLRNGEIIEIVGECIALRDEHVGAPA